MVLKLLKSGYNGITVDMKRGGCTQIRVSQAATFTYSSALLVSGQREQRDCQCQGMANIARVGGVTGTVSAVTMP